MSVPVIAVDGPTASGKGTLARCIAAASDFAHLDTGTLYRAVAAKLLEAGESPDDADAATRAAEVLVAEDLDRADLRQESVSQAASRVARLSPVRAALLEFQRRFAHRPPTLLKVQMTNHADAWIVRLYSLSIPGNVWHPKLHQAHNLLTHSGKVRFDMRKELLAVQFIVE